MGKVFIIVGRISIIVWWRWWGRRKILYQRHCWILSSKRQLWESCQLKPQMYKRGLSYGLPTITSIVGLIIVNMNWRIWALPRGTRREIYTFRWSNCPTSLILKSRASLLMLATGRGVDVLRWYFTAPDSHKLEGIRERSIWRPTW